MARLAGSNVSTAKAGDSDASASRMPFSWTWPESLTEAGDDALLQGAPQGQSRPERGLPAAVRGRKVQLVRSTSFKPWPNASAVVGALALSRFGSSKAQTVQPLEVTDRDARDA